MYIQIKPLRYIRGIIMDQIKTGDYLEKKRWNSNPFVAGLKKSITPGSWSFNALGKNPIARTKCPPVHMAAAMI